MTTFILSKEQYTEYNTHFNAAARNKNLTSSDMILNNILRNMDVKRGFTPITNTTKLGHGANPWLGFDNALYMLRFALRRGSYKDRFGLDLTPEMVAAILAASEV